MSTVGAPPLSNVCVVGGAGFIGSHFVDHLLTRNTASLTVFDNFSSGRRWHLSHHHEDRRLRVIEGDVAHLSDLVSAMTGCDTVIHLASNPDIALAATDPTVDFDSGTLLTHHVAEAMRLTGARRILYASGSGVYGDLGEEEADEDHGPLAPISTYGASKLAGEALLSAYSHMFGITGCVFRFANVVGPRQTHGVGYDFIRRLSKDPERLSILGDGSQSKSYIHVSDVVGAVLLAAVHAPLPLATYNVATEDYITVSDIARMVVEVMGLAAGRTEFEFEGGDRGWRGDIPVVRLSSKRIRALGWSNAMSSRQAMLASLESIRSEVNSGDRT